MFSTAGFSKKEQRHLRTLINSGAVVQVMRGYYEDTTQWSSLFPYDKHRLRAIAQGDRLRSGALTGVSAATVLGLPIRVPRDAKLEIVGRTNSKSQDSDVRRMRWTHGEELEVISHDIDGFRVPVTAPRFVAAQLARTTSIEEAVVAMDYCLHTGLVSHAELKETAQDYRWHPHAKQVALAVALADGLTESPMETRLRLDMLRAGLSGFIVQPEITLYNVGRLIRPDFFFPSHLLIVEYDGQDKYYAKNTAVFDDMARMHDASNSGLSFLRVNKRTLESGEWLRDLNLWLSRPPVAPHPGIEIRGGREIVNEWG